MRVPVGVGALSPIPAPVGTVSSTQSLVGLGRGAGMWVERNKSGRR